ncbi:ADP-ribosylglycohydrolase family protein, partial [bacterium]|nr:ADP-ribosylglycohydrolase family protein [bacterium]
MKNKEYLYQLLKQEIIQKREEGCDVGELESKLESIKGDKEALWDFYYDELLPLSPRPCFPYDEPSLWEQYKEQISLPSPIPLPSKEILYDKILGAWLGRCAGCMLGKPVEGWRREMIRENLLKINEYPLSYYFPIEFFPQTNDYIKGLVRGNITRAMRDDDTDYT